jgi:CDP-paratose synthetase
MNIVLTGASGYLGSWLAKSFLKEGHKVIALKRSSTILDRLSEVREDIIFYDLEGINLNKLFTDHSPVDVIIHTATCYGRLGESSLDIFEANTEFPLRLLDAAIKFSTNTFFNTDTILYPYLNSYSLSKKHFSEWGSQIASQNRIRFVNVRLEHMYGPEDDVTKFSGWLLNSCINNVPEISLTPGEQNRDFVYITDVVSAYLCMLNHVAELGDGFQEIGLGSGKSITIRKFVETVHRLSESSSVLSFGAVPYREHEQMESEADIRRLQKMGWSPTIGLTEGISVMIKNIVTNKL